MSCYEVHPTDLSAFPCALADGHDGEHVAGRTTWLDSLESRVEMMDAFTKDCEHRSLWNPAQWERHLTRLDNAILGVLEDSASALGLNWQALNGDERRHALSVARRSTALGALIDDLGDLQRAEAAMRSERP